MYGKNAKSQWTFARAATDVRFVYKRTMLAAKVQSAPVEVNNEGPGKKCYNYFLSEDLSIHVRNIIDLNARVPSRFLILARKLDFTLEQCNVLRRLINRWRICCSGSAILFSNSYEYNHTVFTLRLLSHPEDPRGRLKNGVDI